MQRTGDNGMTMTGRECVLASLNHEEPERLPVDFGGRHTTLHTKAHQRLKAYLGIPDSEETFRQFWLQTVELDRRLNEILGGDVVAFSTGKPDGWDLQLKPDNSFLDEWGAGYAMPAGGFYYDYASHPLAKVKTLGELAHYPWPDPCNPGRFRGLRQAVKEVYDDGQKAIMFTIAPAGSWEHTWTLRGPEQAFVDLVENRSLYEEILDRTVDFQIAQWEKALEEVGDMIDVATLSDDLGTQRGPMMSVKMYREVFKPRLMRITAAIHKHSKAKIYIHTDGSVYAFLPDLIDAGIDIINPVQKECKNMELPKLKSEFGKHLTFWGASVRTEALEFATIEAIGAEALETIRILAPGGGFVFAPIHNIQPGVPPENIVTLFETARKYGKYPIQV
jgi:uroporphyrinogen decarboxylase